VLCHSCYSFEHTAAAAAPAYSLQVPGRLLNACCKIVRHDIHSMAASVATRAWVCLLQHMEQAGALTQITDYRKHVSPVAASFKQQVLDSELLQQLPLLLTAAADHLDAAAPAGPHDDSSSSAGSSAGSSSDSSSWGILKDTVTMERTTVLLQFGFEQLNKLWPGENPIELDLMCGIHCVLPDAQLAVAILRYLSRRLGPPGSSTVPQHTDGPYGWRGLSTLTAGLKSAATLSFTTALQILLNPAGQHSGSPSVKHHKDLTAAIMHDSSFAQGIAVMLLLLAVTPQVQRTAAAAAQSRSRSTGIKAPAEWQLALQLEDQLVPSCAGMLQLLDCSNRALLWAAAQQPQMQAEDEFEKAGSAYNFCTANSSDKQLLTMLQQREQATGAGAPGAASLKLLQRLQDQHALHLRLQPLFLYAAAQQPSSSPMYGHHIASAVIGSGKARL